MYTLTFSPSAAYELSYDVLDQWCREHGIVTPARELLVGPTCILPASDLSLAQEDWLSCHPDVQWHEHCLCIPFAGPGSDDERVLNEGGLAWCARLVEGTAHVLLPDILAWLSRKEAACS